MSELQNITEFLKQESHLSDDKLDTLFEMLYPEIKRIANMQLAKMVRSSEVTPTLLVNECYLKLKKSSNIDLQNRKHFFSLASRCIRFYLIDLIRKQSKSNIKSEDTVFSISQIVADNTTEVDLLEMGDALERLENIDKELLNIVELRFFGGFSLDEIAILHETNKSHVFRQWQIAKSILMNLIDENKSSP